MIIELRPDGTIIKHKATLWKKVCIKISDWSYIEEENKHVSILIICILTTLAALGIPLALQISTFFR